MLEQACPPASLPWRRVHFIGVGGVGMAGLAHILLDFGIEVTGTDAAESAMLATLRDRGAAVRTGHDATAVSGADLVVFSSAIPPHNPERKAAAAAGIEVCRRGEFLARLACVFRTVVCVGGSHGKTTVTALVVHLLRRCGLQPGYLIGGAVVGWERSAGAGEGGRMLVTEVDESDGTQALMRSSLAVLTNVEDDHFWSVGGVTALQRNFTDFAAGADRVVAWDSPELRRVLASHRCVRYAGSADLPDPAATSLPGYHNRVNACLALLAVEALGVPRRQALQELAGFAGVERRLTLRYRSREGRLAVVEDYAHHPTELAAALRTLREQWPGWFLTVVFQPHRFERIRHYGGRFAEILSAADRVIVAAPFAAWVDDRNVADPRSIAAAVKGPPCTYWEGPHAELAEHLAAQTRGLRDAVVAVIGAGDIGGLVPELVERLRKRECHERTAQLHAGGSTTIGPGAGPS
ncbi:MAG: hypothetical protein JXR77_11225 [Lentisphaeria bacterium]|nr:hypothetical protein [Lentisphaeria bacterium]